MLADSNKFKASDLLARFLYFVPRPFVGGRDARPFSKVLPELRDRGSTRRWRCGNAVPAGIGPHAADAQLTSGLTHQPQRRAAFTNFHGQGKMSFPEDDCTN